MNLRQGTHVVLDTQRWVVQGLDWLPPHQRVIVTMVDDAGRELRLTPHELALNGARNG